MSEYHCKALSLPSGTHLESISMIARAGEWPLVEESAGTSSESHMVFRTWAAASDLWLRYLNDLATDATALMAFGRELDRVETLISRVSPLLAPHTRADMLALPREASTREERAQAIVRAALVTDDIFDQEIFTVIESAAKDQDPAIRAAAIWSTTYLSWPAALTLLEDVAKNDNNEQIRNSAAQLLGDFRDPE